MGRCWPKTTETLQAELAKQNSRRDIKEGKRNDAKSDRDDAEFILAGLQRQETLEAVLDSLKDKKALEDAVEEIDGVALTHRASIHQDQAVIAMQPMRRGSSHAKEEEQEVYIKPASEELKDRLNIALKQTLKTLAELKEQQSKTLIRLENIGKRTTHLENLLKLCTNKKQINDVNKLIRTEDSTKEVREAPPRELLFHIKEAIASFLAIEKLIEDKLKQLSSDTDLNLTEIELEIDTLILEANDANKIIEFLWNKLIKDNVSKLFRDLVKFDGLKNAILEKKALEEIKQEAESSKDPAIIAVYKELIAAQESRKKGEEYPSIKELLSKFLLIRNNNMIQKFIDTLNKNAEHYQEEIFILEEIKQNINNGRNIQINLIRFASIEADILQEEARVSEVQEQELAKQHKIDVFHNDIQQVIDKLPTNHKQIAKLSELKTREDIEAAYQLLHFIKEQLQEEEVLAQEQAEALEIQAKIEQFQSEVQALIDEVGTNHRDIAQLNNLKHSSDLERGYAVLLYIREQHQEARLTVAITSSVTLQPSGSSNEIASDTSSPRKWSIVNGIIQFVMGNPEDYEDEEYDADVEVHYMTEIAYDDPELVNSLMHRKDHLIDQKVAPPQNQLSLSQIIEVFFDHGIDSPAQERSFDQTDSFSEIVTKIENVIGTEALYKLEGLYKYLSIPSYYNMMTNVANTLEYLSQDLNKLIDINSLYEHDFIEDQIIIISSRIEFLVDFLRTDKMIVGMAPRPYKFDPPSDPFGGSGPGSSAWNDENPDNGNNHDHLMFGGLSNFTSDN